LGIGLSELLKEKGKEPESYREALYTLLVNLDRKIKRGEIRAEIITGNEEVLNRMFEDNKIYFAFIRRTEELGKFDDFVILVGRKVLLSTFDLQKQGFERIENPPKLYLLGSVLFAELIKLYLGEIIEEDEEVKSDIRKVWKFYHRYLLTLIRAGLFRKKENIEKLHNFINKHIEQKEINGKEHFQLVYVGNIEDVGNVLEAAAKNEKRLVLIFNNKYNWFLLFEWSENNQRFEPLLYQLPGKLMEVLKKLSGVGKIDELDEEESLEEAEEESGELISRGETTTVETRKELPTNIRQELRLGANVVIANSDVEGDVNVKVEFNAEELKQILESYLQRTPTKEDLENFARNITSIFERIIRSYTTTGKTQELSIGYLIFMLKNQILGQDFNLKYGKFLKVLDEEFTKNLINFVIEKAFYEKGKLKIFQSPEDIAKVLSEYVKIINTEVPKAIGHELLKKLLKGELERNLVIEFFRKHRDILEKFKQAFEKEDEVVLEILGKEIKYKDEKDSMKKLINEIYEEVVGSKVEESKKEKEEKIKEIIKLASEIRKYLEKWKEGLSDEKEKKTAASLIDHINNILKEEYLRNLSLKQLDDLLQRLQKLLDEIKKGEQAPKVHKEETPEVTPPAPPKEEAPEGKPSETPPPAKPITSPGLSRILNTCGQILGWTLIAVGTPIIALGLATALLPLYALYKMKDQIKSITPDIGKALEIFK
jgi:hypothetical protein